MEGGRSAGTDDDSEMAFSSGPRCSHSALAAALPSVHSSSLALSRWGLDSAGQSKVAVLTSLKAVCVSLPNCHPNLPSPRGDIGAGVTLHGAAALVSGYSGFIDQQLIAYNCSCNNLASLAAQMSTLLNSAIAVEWRGEVKVRVRKGVNERALCTEHCWTLVIASRRVRPGGKRMWVSGCCVSVWIEQ